MTEQKKKFKLFRKRCFNLEGLNLKVPQMLINRLNRLVATGMFGSNVEEAAQIMIGLGVAEMETRHGPWHDLIDTRGHPNPKQLFPNPEEINDKVDHHKEKRDLLNKHDILEARRVEWEDDENVTQEAYYELTENILSIRDQLGLPTPEWAEETEEDEEESDADDQP